MDSRDRALRGLYWFFSFLQKFTKNIPNSFSIIWRSQDASQPVQY